MEMKELPEQFQVMRLTDIPEGGRADFLNQVDQLEQQVWPEEIQAPLEKFQSRAEVFPEGFVAITSFDQGMVGSSTSERFNFDPSKPPSSWEEITDNGWIRRSHNPSGDALYVVSVGASPKTSGQGVGTQLVREQISLAERLGLKYVVLGSRLPGYSEYHNNHGLSAEDYLRLTRTEDGLPVDKEIRFYQRAGLEINTLVPNYMEDDPESENYGVIMVWQNPNLPK